MYSLLNRFVTRGMLATTGQGEVDALTVLLMLGILQLLRTSALTGGRPRESIRMWIAEQKLGDKDRKSLSAGFAALAALIAQA